MAHTNDNSKLGSDTDRKLAGEIAATPGHMKAQAKKSPSKEDGRQAIEEVAAGKKGESTDRTGRYR
jgi:hypothetical protein